MNAVSSVPMARRFLIRGYTPPAWAASLANVPTHRAALGHFPTPVYPWFETKEEEGGFDVWIKRDDLSGLEVSGNKIRKLEFLLADAVNQGCDHVVTIGAEQSNHSRATAAAAKMLGLDVTLVLKCLDASKRPGLEGNLLLDRLVGAQIRTVTSQQYMEHDQYHLVSEAAEQIRQQGQHPYEIELGGSSALGTWGYIEAAREIAEQAKAAEIEFTDLVFACGSGGTAAGLALGVYLSGMKARVHAYMMAGTADYFYDRTQKIYDSMGVTCKARDLFRLVEGHEGIGYGMSTREELSTIARMARQTGVVTDPVYSGKTIHGLRTDMATCPEVFAGKRILFLHTGGLFRLFASLSELNNLKIFPEEDIRPLYPA